MQTIATTCVSLLLKNLKGGAIIGSNPSKSTNLDSEAEWHFLKSEESFSPMIEHALQEYSLTELSLSYGTELRCGTLLLSFGRQVKECRIFFFFAENVNDTDITGSRGWIFINDQVLLFGKLCKQHFVQSRNFHDFHCSSFFQNNYSFICKDKKCLLYAYR